MSRFSLCATRSLLALAACAPCLLGVPAAAQQGPAIPQGYARIWILRQYEPSDSLRTPVMYINGAPIGASQPGTIFYRDLPAGAYRVTVDSCTTDVGQAADLNLASGSQVDLEIQSLSSSMRAWGCLVNEDFYVRQIDPARAQIYLPQLGFLGPR
jgi:hypothetical protein